MQNLFFVALLICALVFLVNSKFLWFEKAPDPNDRCTFIRYGLERESWEEIHPDPTCKTGGLIWYYTTGRIHFHMFLDAKRETDFWLCLTGGEANAIYIWYDYKSKYWTPMGFPNYQVDMPRKERCSRSHNGTMDLFFESPWHKVHYLSHVSWEITPIPPGTPDSEDEAIDTSDIPDF